MYSIAASETRNKRKLINGTIQGIDRRKAYGSVEYGGLGGQGRAVTLKALSIMA